MSPKGLLGDSPVLFGVSGRGGGGFQKLVGLLHPAFADLDQAPFNFFLLHGPLSNHLAIRCLGVCVAGFARDLNRTCSCSFSPQITQNCKFSSPKVLKNEKSQTKILML